MTALADIRDKIPVSLDTILQRTGKRGDTRVSLTGTIAIEIMNFTCTFAMWPFAARSLIEFGVKERKNQNGCEIKKLTSNWLHKA